MGSVFEDRPEDDLARIKSLGNEVAFDTQQKIFGSSHESVRRERNQKGKRTTENAGSGNYKVD
jgi:hypothetical protein